MNTHHERKKTSAISRTAIMAKQPVSREEVSTGSVTFMTFIIAASLLIYLASSLFLAAGQ